jgi:MFS family permease
MRLSERLAIATGALSFFISTLDTGIVNVALPQLTHALQINATLAAWTISAYAIALAIMILPFGRIADRFGVTRVSAIGFVLFALFSIACALAPTIGWLIGFRALLGIAAAMLQGTASSFVTRYVDGAHRGSGFGWVSAILSLGAVTGPSLGGFIVAFASWRWIFLAAVPFGIAGLITNLLLHATPTTPAGEVAAQRNKPEGLGRITPFVAAAAVGATFISVFVAAPFELTRHAQLSAWQVGLVLLATPLGAMIAARATGPIVQRGYGVASLLIGTAVDTLAPLAMLLIPPTNLAFFTLAMFVFGVGNGAMQTPAIALALAAFPANAQSTAGALQRFVQNIAISAFAALSGLLIDVSGAQSVWVLTASTALLVIVVVSALTIGSTHAARKAPQPQA